MAVSHAYGGTSAAPVQPGCTTAICLSDWSVSATILEPNLRPPGPTSRSTPASRAVTGGCPPLNASSPTIEHPPAALSLGDRARGPGFATHPPYGRLGASRHLVGPLPACAG